MVYLKSVENVITLGKLIGLLFLFCLLLLSILFLKTKRNDLARPVMGTIFLVYAYIPFVVCVCMGTSTLILLGNRIINIFNMHRSPPDNSSKALVAMVTYTSLSLIILID